MKIRNSSMKINNISNKICNSSNKISSLITISSTSQRGYRGRPAQRVFKPCRSQARLSKICKAARYKAS